MRDRATLAGGHCTIGESPLGGTVVSLWLPGTSAAPSAAPGLGAGLGLTLAASRSTGPGSGQRVPEASAAHAAGGA